MLSSPVEICCEVLLYNLKRLREHIGILHDAMTADRGPLQLADMIRVSEAVRISTIATLADQYKRMSSSPQARLQSPATPQQSRLDVMTLSTTTISQSSPMNFTEDDIQTVCRTSDSSRSPFQSKPLSPPPTPKIIPDDLQSIYTVDTVGSGPTP